MPESNIGKWTARGLFPKALLDGISHTALVPKVK